MTRYITIVLLLLSSQCLFAQQLLKCNERLTDIDLVCEYFSDLDSAFAAKNNLVEIKVTEAYYNQGVLKYNRTKLNYKYDNQFKRIYTEINAWAEDGILIRGDMVRYYKDSVINTQVTRYSYDSPRLHSFTRYVTKSVWLNDTLIKKDSYTFLDDSLYRHDDLGIEDTRAEARELERLRSLPVSPTVIEDVTRNDIIIKLEPDQSSLKPHQDIVKKDSLGRIVEIETFFITTILDQQGSFPAQKYYIEYLGSTKIIRHIRAYHDFNSNKGYFEDKIRSGINTTWNHFWPDNYIHSNLYFEYTASDFKFGIPQRVVISQGKDAEIQRIYKTIITAR